MADPDDSEQRSVGDKHPSNEEGHAAPSHRLLGSMRGRIVLAVVVLLAFSAAVSIVLLRSVLLDRLDEEITVA